jgi:glycosyltransferase involved in cell wall biosynthesis
MKVLITCLSYCNLTGSELYIYELGKRLTELGHEVLVSAIQHNPQSEIVKRSPFSSVLMGEEPDFKPDIIHCHQSDSLCKVLESNTKLPIITTIHSEVIPQHEKPILDKRIKKYICVRPSIQDYCIENGVSKDKTAVIYNPIDFSRFKNLKCGLKQILFAGTYYDLREKAVMDILNGDIPAIFIGNFFVELGKSLGSKYKQHYFLPPVWNIEDYMEQCGVTAGINWGRTMIESFIANRPHINYEVDDSGNILKKELLPVQDCSQYDSIKVVDDIIRVYEESI